MKNRFNISTRYVQLDSQIYCSCFTIKLGAMFIQGPAFVHLTEAIFTLSLQPDLHYKVMKPICVLTRYSTGSSIFKTDVAMSGTRQPTPRYFLWQLYALWYLAQQISSGVTFRLLIDKISFKVSS